MTMLEVLCLCFQQPTRTHAERKPVPGDYQYPFLFFSHLAPYCRQSLLLSSQKNSVLPPLCVSIWCKSTKPRAARAYSMYLSRSFIHSDAPRADTPVVATRSYLCSLQTLTMFQARTVFFHPHESPRYLTHAGRPQDAIKLLQLISPSLLFTHELVLPRLLLQTSFRRNRFQLQVNLQQATALRILTPHDQSLIMRQRERRPIVAIPHQNSMCLRIHLRNRCWKTLLQPLLNPYLAMIFILLSSVRNLLRLVGHSYTSQKYVALCLGGWDGHCGPSEIGSWWYWHLSRWGQRHLCGWRDLRCP